MTTIAYRDGVLASDGRVSMGDSVWAGNYRKVWKLRNGFLFGGAGNAEQIRKLLTAMKRGEDPDKIGDTELIRVSPKGVIETRMSGAWTIERLPYVAIGSGWQAALAAMMAGADAVRAIKIAKRIDKSSGGRTFTVKLNSKEANDKLGRGLPAAGPNAGPAVPTAACVPGGDAPEHGPTKTSGT